MKVDSEQEDKDKMSLPMQAKIRAANDDKDNESYLTATAITNGFFLALIAKALYFLYSWYVRKEGSSS
jgi:hypothetical protein